MRSAGTVRQRTPAAPTSSAVEDNEPGSGVVSDAATVDECSRDSPSVTVRAVSATSNPARARCTAIALPIPRLAPVTKAVPMAAAYGRHPSRGSEAPRDVNAQMVKD